MKQTWKVLATVLLLVLALVLVAACNREEEPDTPALNGDVEDTPDTNDNNDVVEDPPAEWEAPPAPAGHVWSLSRDAVIQGFDVGAIGQGYDFFEDVPYLRNAGSPVFTIVETPLGNKGLELSFRTENWFALDLDSEGFNFDYENYAYEITLIGSMVNHEYIIIGGPDAGWNWLISGQPDDNGNFTLTGTLSTETMSATDTGVEQFNRGFRIQTNGTADFTVYEIEIVARSIS